jgi:hypothetical protein
VRTPGQAEGQCEVDEREDGLGAVAVLFGAAGGEHHRRGGRTEQPRGLPQRGDRHPGDALHPVRPVRPHGPADRVEAGGARRDVLLIDVAVPDGQMQQPVGQREVGARNRL